MRKTTWMKNIGLLLLAFAPAGCPSEPTGETPVGKWLLREPVTGQNYYIYVPNRYRHETPAPVIISCHGTVPFDVSNSHIETWKGFGERYGFIIVCPDLVGTDGILGDGPVSAMLECERRILSILSTLSHKYNLDRANVFLTGFSGGGFPTYFVGLRHTDIFRAVAPRNSNFNERNLDGWYPPEARSMPMFIVWGDSDPATIKAQAENAVNYLRRKGFRPTTKILPSTGHERKPRYSMDFFLAHRNPTPQGTMTFSSSPASARPRPSPATPVRPSASPRTPAPPRRTAPPRPSPRERTYDAPPP
ncbi:MAG: hypothetical protein JW849_08660 [Phycisphaerae bacterium]|nr:hypothetical protein [Phycisphaerae bacterium]